MADNVAITAGSGTTIAADEATYSGDTAKIQLMKPVVVTGTEGSKTVVELTATSAGEQRIMAHRDLVRVEVVSSGLTTSTTAYVAGDQVGDLMTFTNMARVSGGTGVIVGATLVDKADIIATYDVVLFRSSVTLAADNAAFAISDTDAEAFVGIVQLAGPWDLTNNRVAQVHNIAIPYDCSGGTSLYAALVCRGGHTFFTATTDLRLTLWAERN